MFNGSRLSFLALGLVLNGFLLEALCAVKKRIEECTLAATSISNGYDEICVLKLIQIVKDSFHDWDEVIEVKLLLANVLTQRNIIHQISMLENSLRQFSPNDSWLLWLFFYLCRTWLCYCNWLLLV